MTHSVMYRVCTGFLDYLNLRSVEYASQLWPQKLGNNSYTQPQTKERWSADHGEVHQAGAPSVARDVQGEACARWEWSCDLTCVVAAVVWAQENSGPPAWGDGSDAEADADQQVAWSRKKLLAAAWRKLQPYENHLQQSTKRERDERDFLFGLWPSYWDFDFASQVDAHSAALQLQQAN